MAGLKLFTIEASKLAKKHNTERMTFSQVFDF